MELKKTLFKGISWMGALRASTRAIAIVKVAILARLLLPSQFGAFGIATLVLAFLEVFTETGINAFFIQNEGQFKEYKDTAWIVSIARGVIISILILVSAPLVASFFKASDAKNLLLLASLIPFVRGFINPVAVSMQKNLQFKREFLYRFIIYSADAVCAILLALATKSPASLIWGLIIGALVEVVLSFYFVDSRPVLKFERQKFNKIVKRGKWVTIAGIFDYLFGQGDDVIVGKILGTAPLGIYQNAYKISTLPITEVGNVFWKVTFPVYTKLSGNTKRLMRTYLRVLGIIIVLTLPIGLVLYFFPKQIVLILLGPNWLEAAGVLKILALFGVVKAGISSSYSLLLALKKQEYVMISTFVSIFFLAILIFPLINIMGVVGAGWSVLISTILTVPINVVLVRKALRQS